MANEFDQIDIFDTSPDVGSIEPTKPELRSLSDIYFDYLVQDPVAKQVTGGDPFKKALRFVSEFVPGVSTELALREGDPLGVALSSLDLFPATKAIPPAIKRAGAEKVFKYISSQDADAIVPLDQIARVKDQFGRVIKSDPEKVSKAQSMMESASQAQAYKGVGIPKRQPIEVIRMPDGSLQQIGGKSTREALEGFGETEAPVKIFNSVEEFEAYDLARKASKERRRVDNAYQLQPKAGDPTFEQPLRNLGDRELEDLTEQVFKSHQGTLQSAEDLHGTAVKVNDGFQAEIKDIADSMNLEKAPKYKYDAKKDKLIDVEIKELDTIKDKMVRKNFEVAGDITDPVRTRIYIETPQEADEVARRISQRFPTIDSGNQVYSKTGFVDRKLNVQYVGANGEQIVGEIGLITKPMAKAADDGHILYEDLRDIDKLYPTGSDMPADLIRQKEELQKKSQIIYKEAQKEMDEKFFEDIIVLEKRFGGYIGRDGSSSPIDPNLFVNSDFDSLEPYSYQSVTFAPLAGRQSLSRGFMKKPLKSDAEEGTRTAGPLSQEKYKVSTSGIIDEKPKNIYKPLEGNRKLI